MVVIRPKAHLVRGTGTTNRLGGWLASTELTGKPLKTASRLRLMWLALRREQRSKRISSASRRRFSPQLTICMASWSLADGRLSIKSTEPLTRVV